MLPISSLIQTKYVVTRDRTLFSTVNIETSPSFGRKLFDWWSNKTKVSGRNIKKEKNGTKVYRMKASFITALAGLNLLLSTVTALTVHNLPGHSTYDTIAEIKRHLLHAPRAENRIIFSKSAKLDSSLDELPLFK